MTTNGSSSIFIFKYSLDKHSVISLCIVYLLLLFLRHTGSTLCFFEVISPIRDCLEESVVFYINFAR